MTRRDDTLIDPALLQGDFVGLKGLLGFELSAWRRDFARLEQSLRPELMNRQNIPHGGLHATLLDSVMGYAGCYTGDPDHRQTALTLSMTINFVAQAKGTRLIAEGWRVGGGRKTYFAEACITDDTGEKIATATGVFRYLGKR